MDGTARTAGAGSDWLRPDWPAPAWVHALCTTRRGGTSAAPFDSLNLGDHVGDAAHAVQANRRVLQDAIAATTPGARVVFLQQVHGTEAVALDSTSAAPGACADACVAATPGQVCTILVADCLPVLLTNRQGSAVAAAHAGWRGLAGADGRGVLESVLERFWQLAHTQQGSLAIKTEADGALPRAALNAAAAAPRGAAADTLAWLGPCIGPPAFEVGAEVREAFCAHDGAAARHFRAQGGGKYLADLAALARQRLHAAGVTQVYGNDASARWCTVSNPSRFFSHRRSSHAGLGGSGRLAACIWLG